MADLGPSAKGLRAQDAGTAPGVPTGALSWATVHTFGEREGGQAKAACASGLSIYSTSRAGVKRWDAATGSSSELIPSSALPGLVHAITLVGDTIWACTGDGKVALYDATSGEQKAKAFAAHQGEVLCIAAGPGSAYVLTGGVDFNAKSWRLDGLPIVASKYHHGAVECLLVTPLAPPPTPPPPYAPRSPGSRLVSGRMAGAAAAAGGEGDTAPAAAGGGAGGKVWTGSADGTVFCWPDPGSTGQINEAEGKSIKVEGGKVKSLASSADCVWAGMDDGRIHVLRLADGSVVRTLKGAHSGPVLALLSVGDQMWSGSGDKTISVYDARPGSTPAALFTLGDQGGYVKGLLAAGWGVWAFTSGAIKIYTAEGMWHAEAARAEAALAALEASRGDGAALAAQLAQVRDDASRSSTLLEETRTAAESLGKDSEAQLREMQERLQALQLQLDASRGELDAARGEVAGLRGQLAEAQKALDGEREGRAQQGHAAAKELAEARARIEELEAQSRAAASELEAVRAAKGDLEEAVARMTADLEAERAAQETAAAGWGEREGALRSEMAAGVEAARAAGEGEAVQLRMDKAQLEERIKQLMAEMSDLQSSHASLQSDLAAARTAGDAAVAALREQLAGLQRELGDANSRLALRSSELERLRTSLAAAEALGKDVTAARDELRTELERVRSQLLSAQTGSSTAAEELRRAQGELAEARRQVEGKAADLTGLSGQLAESKQRLVEAETARAGVEQRLAEAQMAAERAAAELQDQVATLRNQIQSFETQAREADREREELRNELEAAREHGRALESRAAAAAEAAERRVRSEMEAAEGLKRQLAEGAGQLAHASSRCEDLSRRLAEVERRAREAEGRAAADQEEIAGLRSQVSRLTAEAAAMAATARIREKMDEELERLRSRIRDVEGQIPRLGPHPSSASHPQLAGSGASMPNIVIHAAAAAAPLPGGPHPQVVASLSDGFVGSSPPALMAAPPSAAVGPTADSERVLLRQQLDALRSSSQALEGLVRGLHGALEELKTKPPSPQQHQHPGPEPQVATSLEATMAPLVAAPADDGAASLAAAKAEAAALREQIQATTSQLEDLRAAKAGLEAAMASCQSELNEVLEDRYQLQVALRAAQKQLAEAQAAARPPAPAGPSPETAAKLALLEGALRQTKADYQMLLQEVAHIRGQLGSRDGTIAQLTAELARVTPLASEADQFRAQVGVLEGRCAALGRQVADCEAGRRLFNDLESTHSSMQRRLAAARVSDDIYNSHINNASNIGAGGPAPLQPMPPPPPAPPPDAPPAPGAAAGGAAAGGDAAASGGRGGRRERDRERYLPPNGFL